MIIKKSMFDNEESANEIMMKDVETNDELVSLANEALVIDPNCFEAHLAIISLKTDELSKYLYLKNEYERMIKEDYAIKSDVGKENCLSLVQLYCELLTNNQLYTQTITVLDQLIELNDDYIYDTNKFYALSFQQTEDLKRFYDLFIEYRFVDEFFLLLLLDTCLKCLDFLKAKEVFNFIQDNYDNLDTVFKENLDLEVNDFDRLMIFKSTLNDLLDKVIVTPYFVSWCHGNIEKKLQRS